MLSIFVGVAPEEDVIVRRLPTDVDEWKNHVIIGCTMAVAIEVTIVVVMVMYWRQISWTLRKLTCTRCLVCIVSLTRNFY